MKNAMGRMVLPQELQAVLAKGRDVIIPESREELLEIAMGGKDCDNFEVAYDIPGKGRIVEATVSRCKNGAVVNYQDIYMRRRDPECMLIADQGDTDKLRYSEKFGTDFSSLRETTFAWLAETDLIMMPFSAGSKTIQVCQRPKEPWLEKDISLVTPSVAVHGQARRSRIAIVINDWQLHPLRSGQARK